MVGPDGQLLGLARPVTPPPSPAKLCPQGYVGGDDGATLGEAIVPLRFPNRGVVPYGSAVVGWQAWRLIFGLFVVGAGPPGHFEPPPCGVGGPGLLLRPVPPEGDGHSFLYCFQKGIWA